MLAETVYIFPDTRPKDNVLFPLVQLFRHVVHLTPVENDLPEVLPLLTKELLAQDVLRFHCPAPLGNDRERFLSLVKEIRQRPADYAGLTLSAFGAPQPAESRHAIIIAVRQQLGSAIENKAGQEQAAALWQARLLLKLGEIVEQEEEEIRQSLRRVALQEQGLLEALRQEHSSAAINVDDRRFTEGKRSRLRLKAWRKLLAASSEALLSHIFITSDQEAFAAVIEESNAASQQMLTLSLPAHPASGDMAAQRLLFRQTAAEMFIELPDFFEPKAWESVLEQHYPAASYGRCCLTLHRMNSALFTDRDCQSTDKKISIGLLSQCTTSTEDMLCDL